jgi:hypothetical protein
MSAVATNESKMFIGAVRPGWRATRGLNETAFTDIWTEVGSVTNLGRIGGSWQTLVDVVPDGDDPGAMLMENHVKTVAAASGMQIEMNFDAGDGGQQLMESAEASPDAFAFFIVMANGTGLKFVGLVTEATYIFELADAVVASAFTILLQSNVVRS